MKKIGPRGDMPPRLILVRNSNDWANSIIDSKYKSKFSKLLIIYRIRMVNEKLGAEGVSNLRTKKTIHECVEKITRNSSISEVPIILQKLFILYLQVIQFLYNDHYVFNVPFQWLEQHRSRTVRLLHQMWLYTVWWTRQTSQHKAEICNGRGNWSNFKNNLVRQIQNWLQSIGHLYRTSWLNSIKPKI